MIDSIRTTGQLGPTLKRLRKSKGWSQFELGQKIGLSQERISAIESHPERVSIDQLLTILMALGAELLIGSLAAHSATTSPQNSIPESPITRAPEEW